jgi:two-component system, cell cycle sensor histidine kinase and response regulator CckA
MIITGMINRLGWTVPAANSGDEAIELFHRHQDGIRCVITDPAVPGMDGWETIAALRKIKPDLPIILAGGYDEARAMVREDAERPQIFPRKPCSRDELENALNRALADVTQKARHKISLSHVRALA